MSHSEVNDSPLIIALDYPDQESALKMAGQLDPALCRVKVGKELFTAAGPAILEKLTGLGFEIFLDLKFHDIPATTAAAVAQAADHGVWMVNVHASGGRRMMDACRERLDKCSHKPLLIGVTVLTSMEAADLQELGCIDEPQDYVKRLAQLADSCKLDGVVCSARESSMLRQACSDSFKLVTPGIRPQWAAANDQRRIVTPAAALEAGSDYLVIGRPVTRSDNPVEALKKILAETGLNSGL
ncbi:orotidine-5'-phosphate decarboxylase [Endozoicomonadaceae bacterium StTr2]